MSKKRICAVLPWLSHKSLTAFLRKINIGKAEAATRQKDPVGGKMPNQLGLYDMSGNVWEWCADCWNDNYQSAPADGSAWTTGNCDRRVLRGGSWGNDVYFCRVSGRYRSVPDDRSSNVGFRLVRTVR